MVFRLGVFIIFFEDVNRLNFLLMLLPEPLTLAFFIRDFLLTIPWSAAPTGDTLPEESKVSIDSSSLALMHNND